MACKYTHPNFSTRLQGSVSHAAFANDCAKAKTLDDVRLVRLFANGGRGTGRSDRPLAALIFHHDRPAMINNAIAQLHLRRKLAAVVKKLMHGIAAREDGAGDADFVAHFEGANELFR